jgi:F-type H+-transporting ATPase subunit epsilon
MPKFLFELVSPQKVVFVGSIDQLDVPGADGDFGVLAGHAPLISLLRPGIVTLYSDGERTRIVVRGGFVEVGPAGATMLAEFAAPADEVDVGLLASQIQELEEDVADMPGGVAQTRAAERLEHLKSLRIALARQP